MPQINQLLVEQLDKIDNNNKKRKIVFDIFQKQERQKKLVNEVINK